MDKRDYYDILGVDRTADQNMIKKAYRAMAMKYHPDKNQEPGAIEKMKEINEAYAVLTNPEKRRMYDTYGHAGLQGFTQEDIFGGIDFSSLFRESGLGNFGFGRTSGFTGIFESFFSGLGGDRTGTRTRVRQKGVDLRYDLEVTLEEVVAGVQKTIEFPHSSPCPDCKGTGAGNEGLKVCDKCKGTGQLVAEKISGNSIFRQISACNKCRGRGKIIAAPCQNCQGKGFIEEIKKMEIPVPRGADNGYQVQVPGEGELNEEGTNPGDLFVVINLKKHPVFERHGDDLYVIKEINFPLAALGGLINDIPGVNENLKLGIPEGTQNGTVFRIPDKGVPRLNRHGRGDLYVVVKVITPTNLTDKEKDLLKQLGNLQK